MSQPIRMEIQELERDFANCDICEARRRVSIQRPIQIQNYPSPINGSGDHMHKIIKYYTAKASNSVPANSTLVSTSEPSMLHKLQEVRLNPNAPPFILESQPRVEDRSGLFRMEDRSGLICMEDRSGLFRMEDRSGLICMEDRSGLFRMEDCSGLPRMEYRCVLPRSEDRCCLPRMDDGGLALDHLPKTSSQMLLGSHLVKVERSGFQILDEADQNDEPPAVLSYSSNGVMSLFLAPNFQIDMTVDKAVRITNRKTGILVAVSSCGNISGLIHPSGRVYQYGDNVELMTNDKPGSVRYARITRRGTTFSSDASALVYIVDEAGVRSTTDRYSQLELDFTKQLFMFNSKIGAAFALEGRNVAQTAKQFYRRDGSIMVLLNGLRIIKDREDNISVARDYRTYYLNSNANGNAKLVTPDVYASASMRPSSMHLFVRRDDSRIHYDGGNFVVRNGTRSAGFDEHGVLRVL